MYDVGVAVIKGKRAVQQDSFIITDPQGSEQAFAKLDRILLLVADGVGGGNAGEVASQYISHLCTRYLQTVFSSTKQMPMMLDVLQDLVKVVSQKFTDFIQRNPKFSGMATTLVLALLVKNKLYWLSVGDSHLYLMRNGKLHKLNADHSVKGYLQLRVQRGSIRQSQAQRSPQRNYLLSYFGDQQVGEIDIPSESKILQDQDVLILASDGIDTLNVDEIETLINSHEQCQQICNAIIKSIEDKKKAGQDNTTVLCLRFLPVE